MVASRISPALLPLMVTDAKLADAGLFSELQPTPARPHASASERILTGCSIFSWLVSLLSVHDYIYGMVAGGRLPCRPPFAAPIERHDHVV